MQDKRRSIRLPIELPATFSLLGKPKQLDVGTTVDLSAKGIRLLTKEKLEKHQKLIITVKVPEEGSIVVHAEVVWVKEQPLMTHTEYMTGIKIEEGMPADEARFVRYYARQLKEFLQNKSKPESEITNEASF